jgi:hypothetical protein
MLYAGVFFAFWWPGAAVRFGAARVADRAAPTWRVEGVVRDARTGAGLPRYGKTAAARPEAHRLRVTSAGYRAGMVNVGRQWFVWMPTGVERIHIVLVPTQY